MRIAQKKWQKKLDMPVMPMWDCKLIVAPYLRIKFVDCALKRRAGKM